MAVAWAPSIGEWEKNCSLQLKSPEMLTLDLKFCSEELHSEDANLCPYF